ncbi:MAG: hypothetical protein WC812_03935 [Candidatus Pacearchaeota archaeon]|jgi:hypothetical protein
MEKFGIYLVWMLILLVFAFLNRTILYYGAICPAVSGRPVADLRPWRIFSWVFGGISFIVYNFLLLVPIDSEFKDFFKPVCLIFAGTCVLALILFALLSSDAILMTIRRRFNLVGIALGIVLCLTLSFFLL